MPPVNQPAGSRVPLVAWTVSSSILAVVMAIMAIYFYVDSSKVKDQAETQKHALDEVVTPDMLRTQGDDFDKLRNARSDPARGFDGSMKLVTVAMKQRDQLAKLIGSDNDATAFSTGKTLIDKAKA